MRNIASFPSSRRGTSWIALTALVAVAAIAMAGAVVAAVLNNHPATSLRSVAVLVSPDPRLEVAPTASPSASPVASPVNTPPAVTAAAAASPFVCSSSTLTAKNSSAVARINALRTGAHAGYDRLTVQFSAAQPASVELRPQSGTGFTQGASGRPLTLSGTNGVLVVIHGADLHSSYRSSTDIKTGYHGLAEIRQVEDFEGVVQLGLGVNGPACYRASFLTSPARLVIDIQA